MKKFLQEGGPSQIWVQAWEPTQNEPLAREPFVWDAPDDWSGQLFNYFFLSHFREETAGVLNMDRASESGLLPLIQQYFQEGAVGGLHQFLSEKWAQSIPSCDEDACWFTVAWDNFVLDDFEGKSLGLFFSNERKSFLVQQDTEPVILRGLPMQKPDYAALIIPDGEAGFRLFVAEPGGQTALRTPWTLSLFPFDACYEDTFHAKQFFQMCKSFSDDVLIREKKNDKEKQVAFLSESLEYADRKKEINVASFKEDVLREPAIIDAFEQYQEKYAETKGWNPPDRFAMTDQDQKQARKFVKSVIKLDKNFHVYVHGNKDRIEKGFDEARKLHYYTLWFDQES